MAVETLTIIITAVTSCLAGGLAAGIACSGKTRRMKRLYEEKSLEANALQARLEAQAEMHSRLTEELKRAHSESLGTQAEALRMAMKSESEEILKRREEELSQKARETFSGITEKLQTDLRNMKEAFESNKKMQHEVSSGMKENLFNAVRALEEQTRAIGSKADNLAEALRGQNKLQGCWGETILKKLLENEGFVEGINYDREVTLRDEFGDSIRNEDSGARMRPDYILYFPDNNDIVVDSKVSLAAFADYLQAQTDDDRKSASLRNLASIKEQIRKLAGKNYSSYLRKGHKMLDYTILFIPNYPALQLAYMEEPSIWRDAFARNILITTEETLMPFLRMIMIAWQNTDQIKNQKEIIAAAERMIGRVHDFAEAHARMGKKLDEAKQEFEKCDSKLKDSGQSIIKAARDLLELGIKENPQKRISGLEH